jgi:hypothetical protein
MSSIHAIYSGLWVLACNAIAWIIPPMIGIEENKVTNRSATFKYGTETLGNFIIVLLFVFLPYSRTRWRHIISELILILERS